MTAHAWPRNTTGTPRPGKVALAIGALILLTAIRAGRAVHRWAVRHAWLVTTVTILLMVEAALRVTIG